jgi:hypothetical protein
MPGDVLELLAELEHAEARIELEEEARLARLPTDLRRIHEAEARGTSELVEAIRKTLAAWEREG